MSNLNEEDIAEYQEKQQEKEITINVRDLDIPDEFKDFLINSPMKTTVEFDLYEWKTLVDELSDKEVALYEWKSVYNVKAMEIENTVDFKAIYGKNNADVRKRHIEGELAEWHSTIKDLEFSIDWITRRISFIRVLVKVKRTLIEVKQ